MENNFNLADFNQALQSNSPLSLNNFHPIPIEYVESRVAEFSNLLSSICRLPLRTCPASKRESLTYSFITLRKNIKYALEELGNSCTKKPYNFQCGICDENISVEAGRNMWECFQDHDHFEELYVEFLNSKFNVLESSSHKDKEEIAATSGDSNTDSGIDQQEHEIATYNTPNLSTPSISHQQEVIDGDNSFRFNFPIDSNTTADTSNTVEDKLYPPNLMSQIRKYDKVKECTIQRAGPLKATCLICSCEMNGMRISKHILLNHAVGQRHLRASNDIMIIDRLKSYHNIWTNEHECIQAHQVYFMPHASFNKSWILCTLCNVHMQSNQVVLHIAEVQTHKAKVLEMFEKKSKLYYLLNLQVKVYGVTKELPEEKEIKEDSVTNGKKVGRRRQKKSSDSDATDENKTCNIIQSIENVNSTDTLELIPNRFKNELNHLKRVIDNDKTVIACNLCKCKLEDDIVVIKMHLIQTKLHVEQPHRKHKYNFYCEICNIKITSEHVWMNHNFQGPRHMHMAESRKAKVTEFECTTCKTVIFGDQLSLIRHLTVGGKKAKKEGIKLPELITQLFKSKEKLISEANRLTLEANDVLNVNLTQECCRKLEASLNDIFEGCKVYPFGSRITGIGNKDSDLDVFVDIGDMYQGEELQEPADQVQMIRKAVKAFKDKDQYCKLIKVETARTPILKLHHNATNLDCDLSFMHGLSVENTKYLKLCLDMQPIVQPMIIMIKKWAEQIYFESLTTYALAMMALFYLQQKEYLLSVEKLRRLNEGESLVISGWETINYVKSAKELQSEIKLYEGTVDLLLKEFFEYYGKFDFNTYVVCPLLGRVVLKSQFIEDNARQLPKEMESYVDQLQYEDSEVFKASAYMCIQDPFDLSHNLTKSVHQGTVKKFQTLCSMTLKVLGNLEG